MKKILVLSVLICVAAFGQARGGQSHGGGGHQAVGGGHIPAHGPAPARAAPARAAAPEARGRQAAPATENHVTEKATGHPNVPHVHARNDQWVGHDSGRNDPHYAMAQPWSHGHFGGGFGRSFAFSGGNRERFGFDNFWWDVAAFDYNIVADWNWGTDQIVVYEYPDHDGWYLGYNPRLGTYAHIEYLGG